MKNPITPRPVVSIKREPLKTGPDPAHQTTPASIVGEPAIARLRASGFAVVPFDVPDYAVGEVMTWTGCDCPMKAWEAINCALNWMAIELPDNADGLTKLGSGEITLTEWRQRQKERAHG